MTDAELMQHVRLVLSAYNGPGTRVESAVGALVLGQELGHRSLRMLHNPATVRSYEKLLGVKFSDVCPDRTPLTSRVVGVRAADRLGSYWAVVMGRTKVARKGHLSDPETSGSQSAFGW